MNTKSKTEERAKTAATPTPKKRSTVGASAIKGLEQAIAWTHSEDVPVRVTKVEVPLVDVRALRRKLKLSQAQFAAQFGF